MSNFLVSGRRNEGSVQQISFNETCTVKEEHSIDQKQDALQTATLSSPSCTVDDQVLAPRDAFSDQSVGIPFSGTSTRGRYAVSPSKIVTSGQPRGDNKTVVSTSVGRFRVPIDDDFH